MIYRTRKNDNHQSSEMVAGKRVKNMQINMKVREKRNSKNKQTYKTRIM